MQNVGKAPSMGEEGGWGSSSWMRGGKYLRSPGLCQAQCWAWQDKGPGRRWGLASEAGFQAAPQEARCRQWKPPTVGLVPRGSIAPGGWMPGGGWLYPGSLRAPWKGRGSSSRFPLSAPWPIWIKSQITPSQKPSRTTRLKRQHPPAAPASP